MPRRRIIPALTLSLALGLTTLVTGQTQDAAIAHAKRVIQQCVDGTFEDVAKEMTAQMTAAMSPAQLREVWATLGQQVGPFKAFLDERVTTQPGGITAVILGTQFDKATLNVMVAFDAEQKIGGLRFAPRPAAPPSPPPASSTFTEESVTVGSGEWALPGTVSMPAGRPIAAVVLVHGSGPNDRDETVGPNKPFRDLAWGLADRGIAVLRYEKRTRQHGGRIGSIANFTVREETIDDAVAAAALLRGRPSIDPKRVFVLGHSLGGTVAPRIAAQDAALAGLIIMAGATRPLPEAAREQLTYLATLNPGMNVDQALQLLLKSAPASYWTDLEGYKPAQAAAALRLPLLILSGGRDYQVTEADLRGWRDALAGRDTVTIKSYPTLNHLFLEGEGKSTPAEYERPGRIPAFVLDDIAAWIAKVP